ncbi:hypothetical protein D9615_002702 [Tricholomella constricta]|uniref:DUF6533 domain-containing protein n=1 Tax=Tricholomella constricta TaxID=117010 RepID=A0A8H5M9U1_9AGAR|nr:hypothetical protein D9615_002702 [Tricholomella constricta]
MSASADLYKLLVTAWYHNTIVQYASVSALTFYLYDYTLMLKDEVEYFWVHEIPGYGSLFPILTIGQKAGCMALWLYLILQFRVHALYNQNKIVFFVVSALFIVEVGSMCIIGGLYTHVRLQAPAVPILGTPFCPNSTDASYLFAFQIPLMGFEFILLCLVLFKGILHYRGLQGTSWSTSRIVSVLLRDSLLYFLSIFTVLLINTMMWEVGPATLYPLAATWPVAPSNTVQKFP